MLVPLSQDSLVLGLNAFTLQHNLLWSFSLFPKNWPSLATIVALLPGMMPLSPGRQRILALPVLCPLQKVWWVLGTFLWEQCWHGKRIKHQFCLSGRWDLNYPAREQTSGPCIGSTGLTPGPPGKSLKYLFWRQSFLPSDSSFPQGQNTFWILPSPSLRSLEVLNT